MKFLILGATGMAGHTIAYYLREQGHDVTTYSRKPFPFPNSLTGDLKDPSFLAHMLTGDYDCVVNCIGVLNDACDRHPQEALFFNSYLPHAIANALKNTRTKLIHLSTDCVFSGKTAPYHEQSQHDGETLYDRTKSLGEIMSERHLTFRNSIIGPDLKENGIGLFNWFMKQSAPISGFTGALWNGVTTLTLAKAIEKAAKTDLNGIYHLVPPTAINKYELLQLFNKQFKDSQLSIRPTSTVQIDKTLHNTRRDFHFQVPIYEQMIIEMRDWILRYKTLYPHYFPADPSHD